MKTVPVCAFISGGNFSDSFCRYIVTPVGGNIGCLYEWAIVSNSFRNTSGYNYYGWFIEFFTQLFRNLSESLLWM